MANTIRIKRSGTASNTPSVLEHGELALNYADGKLFYKDANNVIQQLNLPGATGPVGPTGAVGATGPAGPTGPSGPTGPASEALKLNALTFNGVTTTFALLSGATAVYPASAAALIISLNGVVQEPVTDYTVSGNNITFSQAPAADAAFFGVSLNGIAAPITAASITSGTLDAARLPLATTGAAGAIIVGTGLGVSSGTASVTYGTSSGTACQGNDSRLSDARTPTSHTHGNISNAGAIGSTADQFVVTTTSGVLTAVSAATARTTLSVQPTASPAFTGSCTVTAGNVVIDGIGNLRVFTETAQAVDRGGQIGLGGQNGSAGGFDPWAFGVIKGAKENSTSGNFSGYLAFATAGSGGTITTRLTISSTGTATFAGQVLVTAGSGSSGSYKPGLAISGDDDTGVQQTTAGGANTLSVVTNGGERVRVGSTGRVNFFADNEKLGIRLNKGSTADGVWLGSDGADIFTITSSGGTERLRIDASGNVGIGTAGVSNESGFMLHVAGNAFFTSGPNATTKISIDSGDQRLVLGAYYQFGVAAYSFIAATNNAETGDTDLQLRTGTNTRMTIAANGNVGIGIAPSTQLHVGSLGVFRLQTSSVTMDCTPTAGALDGFVWNTNPASYYQWNTGGTQRLLIGSDGKITCKGLYDNTVGATNRDVFVDSGGVVGYVSSIRESKTDIATLDDVSWLSDLSPVSYRYRKKNADGTYSDEADGVTDYGLIAEDVEAVKPELCFYDQVDGEPQLRGVTYSKLITPMLKYVQQLESRIAALEEILNHA